MIILFCFIHLAISEMFVRSLYAMEDPSRSESPLSLMSFLFRYIMFREEEWSASSKSLDQRLSEWDLRSISAAGISNGATNETAIFYNVFIPDVEDTSAAWDVVKEQLRMRKRSSLSQSMLYFYIVSPNLEKIGSHMQYMKELADCDPCQSIGSSTHSFEEKTLQSLYEHSKRMIEMGHNDYRVVYMHSKGTYHSSFLNDSLRRHLTKAIFSDECNIISMTDMPDCNVCSLTFLAFPGFHTPGNMWVSQSDF